MKRDARITCEADLESMSDQEKAWQHLKGWSKARLLTQLIHSAKQSWIEKWAREFENDARKFF